jgi:hypothetical protein
MLNSPSMWMPAVFLSAVALFWVYGMATRRTR